MPATNTSAGAAHPGCACVAIDAYDCWASRYRIHSREFWDTNTDGMEPSVRELVDADGGPCECACHYEDDEPLP